MVVDLGDGEVVEVLSAVAEVAGDERDRWVRVDEVIEVLLSRPSPSGRMWERGLDPWHGLKRYFEQLADEGLVELHVEMAQFVPADQPSPIAGPDDVEITPAGWEYLATATTTE